MDKREILKLTLLKCAKDPIYFIKTFCMIQHPKKGKMLFELYPFQEGTLNIINNNPDKYQIILKSRQLGISTLMAAYSLWLMMFHKDKNVIVLCTKQDTAKNMVTKVKVMYDNVPSWIISALKCGHVEKNKLSLSLKNGSVIKALSTSEDSGRSEAVSLLIVDECISGENTIFIRDNDGNEREISLEETYVSLENGGEIEDQI